MELIPDGYYRLDEAFSIFADAIGSDASDDNALIAFAELFASSQLEANIFNEGRLSRVPPERWQENGSYWTGLIRGFWAPESLTGGGGRRSLFVTKASLPRVLYPFRPQNIPSGGTIIFEGIRLRSLFNVLKPLWEEISAHHAWGITRNADASDQQIGEAISQRLEAERRIKEILVGQTVGSSAVFVLVNAAAEMKQIPAGRLQYATENPLAHAGQFVALDYQLDALRDWSGASIFTDIEPGELARRYWGRPATPKAAMKATGGNVIQAVPEGCMSTDEIVRIVYERASLPEKLRADFESARPNEVAALKAQFEERANEGAGGYQPGVSLEEELTHEAILFALQGAVSGSPPKIPLFFRDTQTGERMQFEGQEFARQFGRVAISTGSPPLFGDAKFEGVAIFANRRVVDEWLGKSNQEASETDKPAGARRVRAAFKLEACAAALTCLFPDGIPGAITKGIEKEVIAKVKETRPDLSPSRKTIERAARELRASRA